MQQKSSNEIANDASNATNQELSNEVTTWAMLAHRSAFAGFIVPFGNLIGPLIVWRIKKEEDEFVDINGKEALNFQFAITVYSMILFGPLLFNFPFISRDSICPE